MTILWFFIGVALAQVQRPIETMFQDGTEVLWIEDSTAVRTHIVWTLARGSAGRASPAEVALLMDVLGEGSRQHRGPHWRWALGQVGATVRMGMSAHRIWFWLETLPIPQNTL